ncbi:putative MFS family arabinose efflux permease [Melghiribacillus thermohalophilus]|uniref:Putative MFS family arabinose efflux permease n=1 Tax=Melghiribacillus thermohalophilus TaxID=1324956 RepID=A0A4R3N8M1_9BACI|nr:MFS transporter [Melghiribacillus thermohalophilus]TCT24576.1 putative MFS family arabinose efflux permease [Melghiribacillus thermohalophilus]
MPKHIWLLIIGTAIQVTGASFIWPLNTIYMHNELGKSLAFAGMILMLNQGAAIADNLIGGTLFDRLGGYKTIVSGTTIALVAAIGLTVYHTILPYAVFLIMIGFGAGILHPAMFAMASSIWPEGGRRAFNAIYVAQNLGVAIGASLGGLVAAYSFSYIFMANAAIYVIFFLFVLLTYKPMEKKYDANAYTSVLGQGIKIVNKSAFTGLMILSFGFFICWVAYVQWQSTIASYTQDLGIPVDQYSLLWTINGFLIVLAQPLVRLLAHYVPSPKKHIVIGNVIFLISFIYLLFAESFAHFAAAMVIITLGEMLVWPAVPTLANELAPKGQTGFYQGITNSVATAGRMMGPVLGGLVVDLYSIDVLFYGLIIMLVIPFFTTHLYDKNVQTNENTAA